MICIFALILDFQLFARKYWSFRNISYIWHDMLQNISGSLRATMLVKKFNIETIVCCFPSPRLITVLQSFHCSKNMFALTLGKERGTIEWEQRSEECLQKIFKKVQEKWRLFQCFVTSIVASFCIQSFTYSLSCDNWLSVNTIHDKGKPPCGWNSCIHSTLSDNCQNLMKPSSLAVASTDPSGDNAPSVIC